MSADSQFGGTDSDGDHLHGMPVFVDNFGSGDSGSSQDTSGGTIAFDIPILSSRPGAAHTIYLDFDGNFDSVWGSYSNITTPEYDIDGQAGFSATELDNMLEIWKRVAEDYSPFDINVTTVDPGDFSDGVGLRVAIGGSGGWLGQTAGGVAYRNSYTLGGVYTNTVFVFPGHLSNGAVKPVAEAASHEAGHAFGLAHQSTYSGTTKTAEYNPGGSGWAPIMGVSYYQARSTWYNGQSANGYNVYQDDMAVIASGTNGFGYRPDDHTADAATATLLTVNGTSVSGSGVVEHDNDLDYFRFTTGAGAVSFTAGGVDGVTNLDTVLEIRTLDGQVLFTSDPSNSNSATLNVNLAAGEYVLVVCGTGQYGAVGQYTVSGTIVTPPAPPNSIIDIVGRDASGQWWVARNTGSGLVTASYGAWYEAVGWRDVHVADLDGDGLVDVVGRTAGGQWWVGHNTGSGFVNQYFGGWYEGANWRDVMLGDFDGDGKLDVIGRTAGGQWWLGHNTGAAFANQLMGGWYEGANWRDVMTGDFDGDGKTDVIGRTAGGQWWLGHSTGTALTNQYMGSWYEGANWCNVMTGDFNGDGKLDVVGRTAGGSWWLAANTGNGFACQFFGGWAGAITWIDVTTGDFDGDGKLDIVGRASNGDWWVARNTGSTCSNLYFGSWSANAGWLDVQFGDFNSDGKLDVIGRNSAGEWWLGANNGSGFVTQQFGQWNANSGWRDVGVGEAAASVSPSAPIGGSTDDLALAVALSQTQNGDSALAAVDKAVTDDVYWLGG